MNESEFRKLLERFRDGTCSPEERKLLERWFDETSAQSEWHWESDEVRERQKQQMLNGIRQQLRGGKSVRAGVWPWLSVAASAVLALLAGWYFYTSKKTTLPDRRDYRYAAVAPGSEQAMLTLSDGSSVLVDDAAGGILSEEGGTKIVKTGRGNLEYTRNGALPAAEGRNTLTIPKGATFKVTLPDGTHVWLNSATRLTYPAGNSGTERRVELSGEAYFEVHKDPARPFKVLSGGTEVVVTGTHFNVAAYDDDRQVLTTLAEGQVIVKNAGGSLTLRPGQQAQSAGQTAPSSREVDIENVLSWKEGYFVFDDADLKTVMKMVARWYDVEVEYTGNVPAQRFGGTFSKSKDLAGLLRYLEQLSTIHFKLQGKKVMVMN